MASARRGIEVVGVDGQPKEVGAPGSSSGGGNPLPFGAMLYIDPETSATTPNGAVPSADNTTGPWTGPQAALTDLPPEGPFWFFNAGVQSVAPYTPPDGTTTLLQGKEGYGDITFGVEGAFVTLDDSLCGDVSSSGGGPVEMFAGNNSVVGNVNAPQNSILSLFNGSSCGTLTTGPNFQGLFLASVSNGWTSSGGNSRLVMNAIPAYTGVGTFTLDANDRLEIQGGAIIDLIQAGDAAPCFVSLDGLATAQFDNASTCGSVLAKSCDLAANNEAFTGDLDVAHAYINGGSFDVESARTWTFNQPEYSIIDGATIIGDADAGVLTINCINLQLRNLKSRRDVPTFVINNTGSVIVDAWTATFFPQLADPATYSDPQNLIVEGARQAKAFTVSGLAPAGNTIITGILLVGAEQLITMPDVSIVKAGGGALTGDVGVTSSPGVPNSVEMRYFRPSGSTDVHEWSLFIQNNATDTLDIVGSVRARNATLVVD